MTERGFTLLEVMIALTIFVVIAIAMSDTASHSANSVLYLQNKTLAGFVAENKLTEMQLAGYPSIGNSTEDVTMASRQWKVHTKVMATSFKGARRIEVSVAQTDTPDSPLVTLIGVSGQHP